MKENLSRREFCKQSFLAASAASFLGSVSHQVSAKENTDEKFQLKYILGSSMYGNLPLAEILPEVKKTGADSIDIWPKVHGNQREQIEEMGLDAYESLLEKYNVKTGMLTHYDLGPFRMKKDLPLAKRLGVKMMISGSSRSKNLKGKELKEAIRKFVEKLKPEVDAFAENGVAIGIENHGHAIVDSPDSLRWFAEFAKAPNLGIALAPYHLPDDSEVVAQLIRDIGDKLIHFYAWQHGMGSVKKLPKEQELMQMPGRGKLDFVPIVKAIEEINYQGWTEIFMHPVPRGIPILETASAVTEEINRSRDYLSKCVQKS